jgi:hypothetical protein
MQVIHLVFLPFRISLFHGLIPEEEKIEEWWLPAMSHLVTINNKAKRTGNMYFSC